MTLLTRRATVLGLSSLSFGSVAWSDIGHNEQGVGVSIISVEKDSLDPTKTAVGIQVDNDRRVDAILRSVETNYGTAEMHKTVKFFGNTTRTSIQFLTVNGRSTSFLRPPTRQITVNEPYTPNAYYAFGFDFGPMGQIYAEWGEP
ncbi:MAG: hypothetical protein AAF826_08095 [Pseudomonadota bacterium]